MAATWHEQKAASRAAHRQRISQHSTGTAPNERQQQQLLRRGSTRHLAPKIRPEHSRPREIRPRRRRPWGSAQARSPRAASLRHQSEPPPLCWRPEFVGRAPPSAYLGSMGRWKISPTTGLCTCSGTRACRSRRSSVVCASGSAWPASQHRTRVTIDLVPSTHPHFLNTSAYSPRSKSDRQIAHAGI